MARAEATVDIMATVSASGELAASGDLRSLAWLWRLLAVVEGNIAEADLWDLMFRDRQSAIPSNGLDNRVVYSVVLRAIQDAVGKLRQTGVRWEDIDACGGPLRNRDRYDAQKPLSASARPGRCSSGRW